MGISIIKNKAGGKVLAGLTKRREDERAMLLSELR